MVEPHHQYRHGMRVWRQADGAPLSRKGVRVRPSPSGLTTNPRNPWQLRKRTTVLSQQHEQDDVLDIDDVIGKRIVETRLHGNLTVREENAIAALEVMSRFAVNPKWLIYLPPTMSPSETSRKAGLAGAPG